MFTTTQPHVGISPSIHQLMAHVGTPLPSLDDLALCRERVHAAKDGAAKRFAAAARKSSAVHAFRPDFTADDWRLFSSYCVATRMPAGFRAVIPGNGDRTLRFVVEGGLSSRSQDGQTTLLAPGSIQGEDSLFTADGSDLDVRAFEDTLVLELTLPRRKELNAACPALAFELLRAAGAAIAARGRVGVEELATN